jgi:spermidine synthase
MSSSKTKRQRRRISSAIAPASQADRIVYTRQTFLIQLLLFLSGASALVFQTLWVKQLSLVVGSDVYAMTIAISAFFAGLAVGGFLFGRRADRLQQPLRLFALLEAGIGLLGVGATFALANTPWLLANVESTAGPLAWLIPFVLVGLPATVMGGSLPVVVRALTNQSGSLETAGGWLYAANTTGAIAGTLLTAFLFIPLVGVFGSSLLAGTINLLVALGAWSLSRNSPVNQFTNLSKTDAILGSRLALVLYAIAGGIALGYEVIWMQVVVQWTSTRTFAFAVVLATYLTGLVLGSACFARRADRTSDPWGWFGLLITAAGVVAILEIALLGEWLQPLQVKAATAVFNTTHRESLAMASRFLVAAVCVVLLPTFFLGGAFPFALRLTGHASQAGRDSGLVLAINSLGGILGTLITGFILVPELGLERSLAVLAVGAAIVGAIAVARRTTVSPIARWSTVGLGGIALIAAITTPSDHLATLLASSRKGTLLFHEPGAGGTVAVIAQQASGNSFRRLYIQGVSNTGDSMTSLRYMRLQALLPLLIHRGEPKSALVIGLGTGITAGSLLTYEGLEKRVCAELMPEVKSAVSLFHGNYDIASSARVDIRLRDGRRELLSNAETYDVITLEPPPPSAAGVVNLYSRDFYELAATRLNRDGLLAQWLPLPTQTEEDTRSLIRSFLDVFPYVTLWTTELHEAMLIGSLTPIEMDVPRIKERFRQLNVSTALSEVGIDSPAALLATYLCDRDSLESYVGDAKPTTDDRPRIEYGPWVLPGDFERMLPHILELQANPPLLHAEAGLEDAIFERRQTLHRFYETAIYAYQKDRVRWGQTIAWVLEQEPNNPYYRWFVGGRKRSGEP